MAGFEQPIMLLVGLLALPAFVLAFRRDEKLSKILGVSHGVILLLLALAAAQPYVQTEQQIDREPEITVLADRSGSADLLNEVNLEFDDVNVETRTIASGNSSDLRQGFLRNIDRNSAYVTVSDFRSSSSLEGVAETISRRNSTLNALKPKVEDESSVTISGPSTTVPGAESTFDVRVYSTEDEVPEPSVTVDGDEVELQRSGDSTWSFTRSFGSTGDHTVKASISSDSVYENNDAFYSTVEVTEKPEILFIGERGALGDRLSRFYEVSYSQSVPDDLSNYYAVIASKDVESSELSGYVAEGNGFIYTGDTTREMNILPVTEAETDQSTEAAKIMLTVDISRSTGDEGVKMSKRIAYNLVEELPGNSKVGVVAYNSDAYIVNEPVVLAENRQMLMDRISRLETGGPSHHQDGVKGAERALNDTGNIIFISDGRAPDTTLNGRVVENEADEKALEAASELEEMRIISVGVGENRDERFLNRLASRTGGHYVDAGDARSIAFEFSAGGAASGSSQLETVRNHFITRDLSLSSQVTNFDRVKTKPGADALVAGRDGSLFLSSWRYGIGRVAAFSGGSSQLNLVLQEDPLLVSRTAAWAVGDSKRKQDRWVEAEDARQPEDIEIRASYDAEGLKRQSEDLYTRTVEPDSTGFGSFQDNVYGYSYSEEYERVGYSPDMRSFVRDTGGQVYRPNETEDLKQDIKSFSRQTTMKRQQLGSYLIAVALLIFLAEIGYRKVKGKK